jgi:hypothetical protein
LFSTESTVTWDEIRMGLDGLSHNYFLNYYKEQEKTDKRGNISAYYKYLQAYMYFKKGDYNKATMLIQDLEKLGIDNEYEKLFLARILELDIKIKQQQGATPTTLMPTILKLYTTYPQIFPFTGLKLPVYIAGADEALLKELKQYNITWLTTPQDNVPTILLSPSQEEQSINIAVANTTFAMERVVVYDKENISLTANAIVQALFDIYQLKE